jgi:CheY-like chemotaxis protein
MTESAVRDPVRVLLVENEYANRALVEAVVTRAQVGDRHRFELTQAVCLNEALEAVRDRTFDVILLDVRLPDGSGLDVAKQMRAMGSHSRIVVMSASVHATEQEAALAAGADTFIGKPFRSGQLVDLLHEVGDATGPARPA